MRPEVGLCPHAHLSRYVLWLIRTKQVCSFSGTKYRGYFLVDRSLKLRVATNSSLLRLERLHVSGSCKNPERRTYTLVQRTGVFASQFPPQHADALDGGCCCCCRFSHELSSPKHPWDPVETRHILGRRGRKDRQKVWYICKLKNTLNPEGVWRLAGRTHQNRTHTTRKKYTGKRQKKYYAMREESYGGDKAPSMPEGSVLGSHRPVSVHEANFPRATASQSAPDRYLSRPVKQPCDIMPTTHTPCQIQIKATKSAAAYVSERLRIVHGAEHDPPLMLTVEPLRLTTCLPLGNNMLLRTKRRTK